MEIIFFIIIGVLIITAFSDLVVGVSNDAVNFLSGAVGSKAAPLRIIMIVAAAGILAGATFSNGMMEIARKGLISPEWFSYKEIMILFVAVMITDVILLDLFNTFGLPTSTTVSMVFEILGAGVGLAVIKIVNTTGDFAQMANYINTGKVLAIISGILLSVVIAFTFGSIVQWFSRLLFSFNFEKKLKYYGGLFGGFAITCIVYFILIKGLKDSVYAKHIVSSIPLGDWSGFLASQDFDGFKSLVKSLQTYGGNAELANWGNTLAACTKQNFATCAADFSVWAKDSTHSSIQIPLYLIQYVNYYTFQILTIGFLASSIILQLFYWLFRLNILKFIVLVGTFALAMAFAGNDLVNFIGVPLAGLSAHQEFMAHPGADPDSFLMGALTKPVSTPTLFLLIAGVVMVATLWLSKKAKTVMKTSLDLSDQDVVHEKFESNRLARGIVRQAIRIGNFFDIFIPRKLKKYVSNRFDYSSQSKKYKKAGISFDLVRAAVTLVTSSALIAFGTSLKLPLSTTYVTFMVAMGTSFADGAWDRESAVFRVTGVITVIGGWFFTAFSAFTLSLLVATFLIKTWWFGIFIMVAIAVFLLIKSHFSHKKRENEEKKHKVDQTLYSSDKIFKTCSNNIADILEATAKSYEDTIDRLVNEKRKKLKETVTVVDKLNDETKRMKKDIPLVFKQLNEDTFDRGHYYTEIVDYIREAMHCMQYMTVPAYKHVDNNHKPFTSFQSESLVDISKELERYLNKVIKNIAEGNFKNADKCIEDSRELVDKINSIKNKQLKQLKKEPGSSRSNILYLDMLNETRNMVMHINNMYKSFRDFALCTQK